MALLLNIDTATETASVCISLDGRSLAFSQNENQREHASFVHTAIAEILTESGCALRDIDAFCVTSGPGSYTGLRVAMAAAKGFCYAFAKPLITVNTLEVMSQAAVESLEITDVNTLLCPMIDARRMEVFTALYDINLQIVLSTRSMVLQKESFDNFITEGKVVFFGSGSSKFKQLSTNENALFASVNYNAKHLASLADKAFQHKGFADITYSEPNYFKEFYTVSKS